MRVNQNGQWLGTPVARGMTGSAGATSYTKIVPGQFRHQRIPRPLQRIRRPARSRVPGADIDGKLTGTAVPRRRRSRHRHGRGPWRCGTEQSRLRALRPLGQLMDNFGMQCRQAAATFVNSPPSLANPGNQSTIAGRRSTWPSVPRIRTATRLASAPSASRRSRHRLRHRSHHRHADGPPVTTPSVSPCPTARSARV